MRHRGCIRLILMDLMKSKAEMERDGCCDGMSIAKWQVCPTRWRGGLGCGRQ
jgi:hypothetical protein